MPYYFIILSSFLIILLCFLYIILILDSILANVSIKYIDVSTSKKATRVIKEILDELNLKEAAFFDLGSGRGALAIRIKRFFPCFNVYGFDRSPFKIYLSRIRAFLSGQKVVFIRKNIFNINLGKADIIYVYIWPETMKKLKEKLEKELKPGATIIASTFPVPGWQPQITKETLSIKKDPGFERIYVYRR